jgi:SPP1 family predicted phage head-tail adaptor
MNSNDFNKWISLYKPVQVRDSTGGTKSTLTKIVSVWAKVKTLDGAELLRYGVIEEVSAVEISTRYRKDILIDKTVEIKWGTRTFSVRSVVNENEGDTFFKILAVEKK